MKHWTKEEDAILAEIYPTQGAQACLTKLTSRTQKSIGIRASRLGLVRIGFNWSKQEDDILKEYYPTEGPDCYVRLPNRTKESVVVRATQKLKLKAPTRTDRTHLEYENILFEKEIDYWPVDTYINSYTKIRHECLKGHIWSVDPNSILKGSGCPFCSCSQFKRDQPAILYYVKIADDFNTFYKIGVTNGTVASRFINDKDKEIVIGMEIPYETGYLAEEEERRILQKYDTYRVNPGKFIKTGNTELFQEDVLSCFEEFHSASNS